MQRYEKFDEHLRSNDDLVVLFYVEERQIRLQMCYYKLYVSVFVSDQKPFINQTSAFLTILFIDLLVSTY